MAVISPPTLPPTRNGRTLFVASVLLGVIAAVQVLALGWHFAHVNRGTAGTVAHPAVAASVPQPIPPPAAMLAETPPPAVGAATSPVVGAPDNPLPNAEPAAATASAPQAAPVFPTLARPTPAPEERSHLSPAELLAQARDLRQRGDMQTSLARLRDAQSAAPDNPMLIAETALTYEAMQLGDRAFEQWQRLYNMGESTGALYYMADGRLHSVPPAPGTPAAPSPARAAASAGRDGEGFQENAVLKITNLQLEEIKDPEAEKKLSLKIAVKNKPGVVIDPNRVSIKAIFYDLLDGKDIVITNAQTGFGWQTSPVNWANDETEILETTYLRPKTSEPEPTPAAAATEPADSPAPSPTPAKPRSGTRGGRGSRKPAPAPPELTPALPMVPVNAPVVRTYLGYSVSVYYDHQLQDQQAEPIKLLQQFPPPLTLSPQ
jgi:hypothetical protein